MKKTQRDRIRSELLATGSVTNVWAVQNGIFRASERIRELQAEGMAIEGDWVRVDGRRTQTFRYTLVGGPKPKMVAVIGPSGVRFVPEEDVHTLGLTPL